MKNKLGILYKPETHRFLYILLLIATPFLLLQNYLQSAIGELSNLSFTIFHTSIPVTITIAVIIIIIAIIINRSKLNKQRIISWFVIIIFLWIGQKSTDFYFNHRYYELQYNWHFFAYAIFAYLNYRVLSAKNAPPQKIMLLTFVYALAISTLDEAIQIPLSNRIFDIGDIAKDLWGTMIGMFFIFFILENSEIVKDGWKIRHSRLESYLSDPLSVLIAEFIFAYVFMTTSALLAYSSYIAVTIIISVLLIIIKFVVVHLSQKRSSVIIMIIILVSVIVTQGFFLVKYYDEGIVYYKNRLLVYDGIPIYFFDVLIYPNGTLRLVDKKKVFNQRDQQTITDLADDIIIIGSGTDNSGGKGFPLETKTQFIFNESRKLGIQLIILENNSACEKFNSLRAEGKYPLLILHNN